MFTGIVEELGRVRSVAHRRGGAHLVVEGRTVTVGTRIGDSIALNGCCLTVVELGDGWWAADVQTETLERTTLAALAPGDPVNLERPLRIGDRLGGHLVLGHVDGVGEIVAIDRRPDGSALVTVHAPDALARYLVERGSVAVDGASLTIAALHGARFDVALVPHTLALTTLGVRRPGDRVNLEADMIAKHVERLLVTRAVTGAVTRART